MYFAALLARTEDGWEASDTELDNVETLSDLAFAWPSAVTVIEGGSDGGAK